MKVILSQKHLWNKKKNHSTHTAMATGRKMKRIIGVNVPAAKKRILQRIPMITMQIQPVMSVAM